MKNLMLVFAMMTMVLMSCKKEEVQLPDTKEELLQNIPVGAMVDSKGMRVDVPSDFKKGTPVPLEVGEYVYKASEKNLVTVKVKACESCRGGANVIDYAIAHGYEPVNPNDTRVRYEIENSFNAVDSIIGGTYARSNGYDLVITPYFNDTCIIISKKVDYKFNARGDIFNNNLSQEWFLVKFISDNGIITLGNLNKLYFEISESNVTTTTVFNEYSIVDVILMQEL